MIVLAILAALIGVTGWLIWLGFLFKVILGWLVIGALLVGYGLHASSASNDWMDAYGIFWIIIAPGAVISAISVIALLIYGLVT